MIEYRRGDIFDQRDLTHIVHQANLYHTFGSGIAKEIKKRFPYALAADKNTPHGSKSKLGTFSFGWPSRFNTEGFFPCIVNLYSQDGLDSKNRTTDYAAMRKAFKKLRDDISYTRVRLGIPHGIGCGLGGGDWKTVHSIITGIFSKNHLEVVICKLD